MLEPVPNDIFVVPALLQESEVQGEDYTFALPASMQAEIDSGSFLEAATANGPHVQGMFGISFSAIRSVAATGDLLYGHLAASFVLSS